MEGKIARLYFWGSKMVSAVLMFAGSMSLLSAVNDLDRVFAIGFSVVFTALVLKESW